MIHATDSFIPTKFPDNLMIRNVWALQDYHPIERTEVILPKGTVELIFNLSEEVVYSSGNISGKYLLPECFLNGMNIQPFSLKKKGLQRFLGVQLNTIGLGMLFGVTVSEFMDAVVDGKDLCKSLKQLTERLHAQNVFQSQVKLIMQWVEGRLATAKRLDILQRMHDLFYTGDPSQMNVQQLSRMACVSERQLRRWALSWVGMGPEAHLQYRKYLKALKCVHQSELPLTDAGLICGYYDQSHFIREFKHHTHMTPSQYRHHKKGMPGHLFIG